jgi:drug/metabolite transporter (DMT)-like permease
MSKAKSIILILIGGLCVLLAFRALKAIDADLASAVVDFFDRYRFHLLVTLFAAVIGGAILKKMFATKSPEEKLQLERRVDYFWLFAGSLTYGIIFIFAIERDDYSKLTTPILFLLIAVVPFLYDRWDRFVDRHA